MTIQEIAQKLTDLCQTGKFNEAYTILFADHAKSIEPDGTSVEGLSELLKKGDNYVNEVEFVKCEVGASHFASNYFSMVQIYHTIDRATGKPRRMEEICVYKVADGKIIEERFFY